MRRTPKLRAEPALHAPLRGPEVPAPEFAQDQPTTGLQDADHFPDRRARIVDKAEGGDRHDAIEVLVGKWKVASGPFDQIDLDGIAKLSESGRRWAGGERSCGHLDRIVVPPSEGIGSGMAV